MHSFFDQNDRYYKTIINICDRDLNKKRKIGESDEYIYQIIRKDNFEEFTTYVAKESCNLNQTIPGSFFETNTFLFQNDEFIGYTTLIEFAAFFGSNQIFKYLFGNGSKIEPIIWLYAIHGDDPEIIHFLVENNIKQPENSYEIFFKESLKCHHNHIIIYIEKNLSGEKLENYNFFTEYIFHCYNFAFFPSEFKDIKAFYYACKYDYYYIFEYFLNNCKVNINEPFLAKNIFYFFIKRQSILQMAAMKDNQSIIKLLLENQEIKIKEYYFIYCKLTKFPIPSSVTSIGKDAFYSCNSLTQIEIPSSITSIGSGAFKCCSWLIQISIPSSVTSIQNETFSNCINLNRCFNSFFYYIN